MNLCPDTEFLLSLNSIIQSEQSELTPEYSRNLSSLVSMIIEEELTISRQSTKNKKLLFGEKEGSSLEIQLFQLQYSDIQALSSNLKQAEALNLKLYHLISNKFYYDIVNKTWVLVVLSEFHQKITLNSCIYSQVQSSLSAKLPIESTIYLILKIIELANEIIKTTDYIGPILLESMYYVLKESVYAVRRISAELYFDFFTPEFLQKKVPFPDIYAKGYTIQGFYWSLGVAVYRCLTGVSLENLPKFAEISEEEVKNHIKAMGHMPGLTLFLISLFDGSAPDFETLINSTLYQTWALVIGISHKRPDKLQPSAVFTTLFFTNHDIIFKNLALLSSAQEFMQEINNEVFISNAIHERLIKILVLCPQLSSELLEFTLLFIKILKNRGRMILKKACIPLFNKIIKQNPDFTNENLRRLFISLLISIFEECTLTIQMIFYHGGILTSLCDNFPADCSNLFPYISYLGIISIKFISFYREQKKFSDPMNTIVYMQRIPAHIKLQMTEEIMKELEVVMNVKTPTLVPDQRRVHLSTQVLCIIYELLHGVKEAKIANRLGMCYRNPQGYNTHPVMVDCRTCRIKVCASCGIGHQELGHTLAFLTYSKLINWACEEKVAYNHEVHPSRKRVPISEEVTIKQPENDGMNYVFRIASISMGGRNGCENYFYCEILVACCNSEEIVVELEGTGIVFDNMKAVVKKNNIEVCNFPRIGENDRIGIGVTADCFAFFTYNGFIVSKYIDFTSEMFEIVVRISASKKPVLESCSKCLYNESAFDYLEKKDFLSVKNIVWNLWMLITLRDKVFKNKLDGRESLFAVISDIQSLIPNSEIEAAAKTKRSSDYKRSDSGCKPF